jgi:hypothetical protein
MDAHVYLGLGLSFASFFGRYAMPEIPKPVAWSGVVAGLFLASVSLWGANMKPPAGSLFFGVAGFICFGIAVHLFLSRVTVAPAAAPPPPTAIVNAPTPLVEPAKPLPAGDIRRLLDA